MMHLFLFTLLAFPSSDVILIDFEVDHAFENWTIVDDRVMGGRSYGYFDINEEGHGLFHGDVSTENNGGFSSVRFLFEARDLSEYESMVLKVKGDGKEYQLRIKSDRQDRESYVYSFKTSGEWEEVVIPLREMKPSWRGRTLTIPNYDAKSFQELGILIGNKRNEDFALEIDHVAMR